MSAPATQPTLIVTRQRDDARRAALLALIAKYNTEPTQPVPSARAEQPAQKTG